MTALITNAPDRDREEASSEGPRTARTRAYPPHVRTLCRFDDGTTFAYRRGRDFFRAGDDTLWAHDSDGLLLSARSCTPLLRRIGNVYFGLTDHLPCYYERAE